MLQFETFRTFLFRKASCLCVHDDVMMFNRSVVFLDFCCQQLGDEKVIVLASLLRTNGTRGASCVQPNQHQGGLALSDAVKEGQTKLVELDLTGNNVNDIVVQAYRKPFNPIFLRLVSFTWAVRDLLIRRSTMRDAQHTDPP